MDRIDAADKASGKTTYVADLELPNMSYAVAVRSTEPHARIISIDIDEALKAPGVIGVFTAKDIQGGTYGRWTRDIPILAKEKVRFVGERVAAVVAESRILAEAAAALVYVEYDPLPVMATPEQALAEDATPVHDEPWIYPKAHHEEGDGQPINLQATHSAGSKEKADAALAESAVVVDETYIISGVHQGYLETQASVADYQPDGSVRVWCTNKSPFLLRNQLAACLDMEPSKISIQPIPIGGDFGGKGSPEDSPLAVELSRLVGRPVKIVLRYGEDLIATNPRHPCSIHMKVGSDAEGHLTTVWCEVLLNGGAYVGYKPGERGLPGGFFALPGYRVKTWYSGAICAYTNCAPRGNMRAPGSPQYVFAVESVLDELAHKVGITPEELRERNLLDSGETNAHNHEWFEHRGHETLKAALANYRPVEGPEGWLTGRGISIGAREDHANQHSISMRIREVDGGGITMAIGHVETGTGSHTAMRKLVAASFALPVEKVEITQLSTTELLSGVSAGGSMVTVALAAAAEAGAAAWHERGDKKELMVDFKTEKYDMHVGTYTIQIAQVAIDPETGQVKVLEILTAADVAEVINEKAHQMQIDGGTIMGFGYACLEDLDEADGQIWAANLGEFKLPSEADAPALRTVLLRGGKGVGATHVKQIGESTTPPVAAAIANAVFDACGARVRHLPITAERVFADMKVKVLA